MKKKIKGVLSTVVKALSIIMIIVFVLFSTNKDFGVFGYHFYHVVTRSMDSVIPVNSLIIVKETDPKDIKVGDDITFYVSKDTSKTHRIVAIEENYDNTAQRGYTTKGVDNPSNDDDIVLESNVVGKVIYHIKDLGLILDYLAKRVWMIIIFIILINLIVYYFKKYILEWGVKDEKST